MSYFHTLLSSQGGILPSNFSPLFWHDFSDPDDYSSLLVDNNNGLTIDAATAKTGQTISAYGALATKPSYNGEGTYFNGFANGQKTGVAGTWNRFHSGNAWSMFFLLKPITVANTVNYCITGNSAASAGSRGICVLYDNRASSSRTNALVFTMSNGTALNVSFVANNAIVPESYHIIELRFDGTNFRAFVDGVQVGLTTAATNTFSSSDAAVPLTFGCFPTTGTLPAKAYYKHAVFFDRILSTDESALLYNYLNTEKLDVVTMTDANVYVRAINQSNESGRGTNSAIAAELTGKVGAGMWKTNASFDSRANWDILELGVNQSTESVTTQHGSEMRFGYEMYNLNQNCYIIKLAEGGTPLASTGDASPDWNTSSVGEFYDRIRTNHLLLATDKMVHVLRKNPVFRGFITMGGESDCQGVRGAAYKTNFTNTFNGILTYINSTLGFSTAKMRLYINRVRLGITFSGFDSAQHTLVRAAQDDIGANFKTDNPSAILLSSTVVSTDDLPIQGDNLHFTTGGFDTKGMREYTYFAAYVNE
jgi:hypothetical protein